MELLRVVPVADHFKTSLHLDTPHYDPLFREIIYEVPGTSRSLQEYGIFYNGHAMNSTIYGKMCFDCRGNFCHCLMMIDDHDEKEDV
jgi:hypothetical protein